MSLTASPLADAPYAAAIHAVELDDFGHSFRPVAPGLFTCPIDIARLETLHDGDEARAVLRGARER
jgi:methionine synthase I (cobalamin-dependent)